jgi:hypothetical protein
MADVIERAQELLQIDPPPADIEQQLRALEEQANEFEQAEFPWIWEAWAIRQDELGPTPLKVPD